MKKKIIIAIYFSFTIINCLLLPNNFGSCILHNDVLNENQNLQDNKETNRQEINSNEINENIDKKQPDSNNIDNYKEENLLEPKNDQESVQVSQVNDVSETPPFDQIPNIAPPVEPTTPYPKSEQLVDEVVPVVPPVAYSTTSTTNTTPNHETSTQPDTKTQASIVAGVVVNKAEMQSFEEWKEMKLKDAAKQHAESVVAQTKKPVSSNSQQQTSNTQSSSSSQGSSSSNVKENSDKTEKKEKVLIVPRLKNYASLDCGAKIIANNPESSNPSHILTESKDDYMLNSCSNKVWFVIELCEPIKINEIQLANFELFSNVPRLFKVYASERYVQSSNGNSWPAKYLIGTFEALNTRNLQSFSTKNSIEKRTEQNSVDRPQENNPSNENKAGQHAEIIMYAKFVKFEMLSHYGNEHFCPLSLVRIFGSSISDDDETDVVLDVPVTNSFETNSETEIKEKVEKLEIKDNKKQKSKILELTSSFLSNVISVFLSENFNLPNLFTSLTTINFSEFNHGITKPSKSTRIIANEFNVENSSSDRLTPPIDYQSQATIKTKRNLILQMDLHKLLCFTSSNSNLDCCQCFKPTKKFNSQNFQSSTSSFNFYSSPLDNLMPKYCGYYYIMMTTVQTRSNNSLLNKYLSNMRFSLKEDGSNSSLQTINNKLENNFTHISINKINYYILNEWLDNQTLELKTNKEIIDKYKMNHKDQINSDSNVVKNDSEKLLDKIQTNQHEDNKQTINLDENSDSKNDLNNSEFSLEKEIDKENLIKQSETQILTESDSQIEKLTDSTNSDQSIQDSTSTSKADSVHNVDNIIPTVQPLTISTTPHNSIQSSTTSEIPSTTSTSSSSSSELPPVVTPIVIANGKDAVFMRLNNRIKILELNMSLSSQYLEKLSQHYRKQMDEMQKAFNVTTTALIDTIRVADERDIKQNEKIVLIEKKIEKMQQNIDSLSTFLSDLKFQTNIVVGTIIIMMSTIVFIEFMRCIKNIIQKDDNKSQLPISKPTTDQSNNSQNINNISQIDLEILIEKKIKLLLMNQEEHFKRQIEILKNDLNNSNQIRFENLESSATKVFQQPTSVHTLAQNISSSINQSSNESAQNASTQIQQQTVTAAAVVSSTLAVVAAVSLAAANVQRNTTLNQTNEET